jgi:hypothetical protein
MRTKVTMKSWRVFLGLALLAAATAAPWAAARSQEAGEPAGGCGCTQKLKIGTLRPIGGGRRIPNSKSGMVAKLVFTIPKAAVLFG